MQFNNSYNSSSSYHIIYADHVPGCILEVLYNYLSEFSWWQIRLQDFNFQRQERCHG